MAACKFHPDRPGVGICVRCRGVLCKACRTPIDSANHCADCLGMLAEAVHVPGSQRATRFVGSLVGAGVALMVWATLLWLTHGWLAPGTGR